MSDTKEWLEEANRLRREAADLDMACKFSSLTIVPVEDEFLREPVLFVPKSHALMRSINVLPRAHIGD